MSGSIRPVQYKFGFSRLWDNLSIEIRNQRMTRDNAITIISEIGDQLPIQEIGKFCRYVELTENEYFEIAEQFRNPRIWKK